MQERKNVSTEPSDRGIERGATCTRPKSKFRGLFDRIVEHMTIARTLPIISRIKVIFVHIPPYGELVLCDFTTDFVYRQQLSSLFPFSSSSKGFPINCENIDESLPGDSSCQSDLFDPVSPTRLAMASFPTSQQNRTS